MRLYRAMGHCRGLSGFIFSPYFYCVTPISVQYLYYPKSTTQIVQNRTSSERGWAIIRNSGCRISMILLAHLKLFSVRLHGLTDKAIGHRNLAIGYKSKLVEICLKCVSSSTSPLYLIFHSNTFDLRNCCFL